MKRLIAATTNAGKVVEFRAALEGLKDWSIEPLPTGVPTIEETEATFLDNALQKARHYGKYVNDLILADDSGLCVNALDGRPGVHSARYAPDQEGRIRRLLSEMENLPAGERGAAFFCALAVARASEIIWTVQRDVSGTIARAPAGVGGFGYDPVFLLPELNRTMAELSTDDKNRLSARGQALAELRKFMASR